MGIKEIVTALTTEQYTNDELDRVAQALVFARSQLRTQVRRTIKEGSRVQWNSNRAKCVMTGVVIKIATKNATVNADGVGPWKVPMNMLTVVE